MLKLSTYLNFNTFLFAQLKYMLIFTSVITTKTTKMITTKKEFAGNYKVFKNGAYVGYVMISECDKFWTSYDTNGQPCDSASTKKEVLTSFECI
jgi:hypothetical protein